ncbi:hypothetical protein B4110_2898 [Parageobacillus toebii]|uniref:Uncharacterized protein n=2 Tax=Parageobacillus toebii TaxID=153151 RepID=A0AA89NTL6_9BACL|nr:hypothetical protein B4110_2898 [Parageobacillus toebii]MBB3869693.1 hypothetical protein [Parageobacillus toebii NBRC 107807]
MFFQCFYDTMLTTFFDQIFYFFHRNLHFSYIKEGVSHFA